MAHPLNFYLKFISCPINLKAAEAEVPMDNHGLLEVPRTRISIRPVASHRFEKVPLFHLLPSMRPTLLVANFLAVLPVSLICLFVPPYAHVYQSVCSQFISATPSPAEPARRANPTIVALVYLDNEVSYTSHRCRQ